MTDHDRAATRREIINAFVAALDRRHEVLDVIVEAEDRPAAVEAIATLLGITRVGSEAVIGMSFRPTHQRGAPQNRRPTRGPEQPAELHPRRAAGELRRGVGAPPVPKQV